MSVGRSTTDQYFGSPLQIMLRRALSLALIVTVCSGCTLGEAAPASSTIRTPVLVTERADTSTASSLATASLIRNADAPERVLELDSASLGLPAADGESRAVNVGLFLTTRPSQPAADGQHSWSEADVVHNVRRLIVGANAILAQCSMHVAVETTQVLAVPDRLLRIQGNQVGSWGGHPPPGTDNPELFNYEQNERLTDDTRELFGYGKQHTSPNSIAVFTVEHITYYAERELTNAAGLSFPPNVYHHADDYPLRNSVLMVGRYAADGSLPVLEGEHTLAHELGHMLLNTGDHERDTRNLMSGRGTQVTPAQCQRMRNNQNQLFGAEAVPDPGPP